MRAKTTGSYVALYSTSRIAILLNGMTAFVIGTFVVLPVVTEHYLAPLTSFKAVGLLLMFTILFTSAMRLLTRPKGHEVFAVSTAYFVTMVLFLGVFKDPAK